MYTLKKMSSEIGSEISQPLHQVDEKQQFPSAQSEVGSVAGEVVRTDEEAELSKWSTAMMAGSILMVLYCVLVMIAVAYNIFLITVKDDGVIIGTIVLEVIIFCLATCSAVFGFLSIKTGAKRKVFSIVQIVFLL